MSNFVQNVLPWVSTAVSALGGIFGGLSQSSMNSKMLAFNREEAEKQRSWLEGMWNKNNLYNTPANQLQLMEEAGLNPNNFQTSVSGSTMQSGGSPASAPSSVPQSPLQAGLASALSSAQLRLMNAEAEKVESEADRTKKLLPGELDVQGMTLALGREDVELKKVERDKIKADMLETEANIRNLDERTNNLIKERDLLSLSIDEKKIFLKDFEKRLYNELLLQRSKLKMDDYQCKYLASQIALNASQIEINNQTATNLYDVHLLNGVELKYKDKSLKLSFDTQSNEYNLSVLKGVTETRKAARRADNTGVGYVLNTTLDYFDTLTSIVGNCFGGAIESHFSYHK